MTMLDQALGYARRGWHVFPVAWPVVSQAGQVLGCCCRDGPDCEHLAKHPICEHGVKDATTDPALITVWWRHWPRANIGIATGEISGIIVLDVDPRHGGDRSVHQLLGEHGRPPPTPAVITGGGGRHVYWLHPGGPVRTVANLAPGLELKSNGGSVTAPPSLHASSRRYMWHRDGRLDRVEIQPAPDWLWDQVVARTGRRRRGKSKALAACRGHAITPDRIPVLAEGTRNDELMRIAARLRWEQRVQADANKLLHEINNRCCKPPLAKREVDRILNGVYRRYVR